MIFEENDFSCHILLTDEAPSFTVWLPLLFETYDNLFIVTFCVPVYDINFEIYLSFLIKPFYYKKIKTKT